MKPTIMSPTHPSWIEFCARLQKETPLNGCEHNYKYTMALLQSMDRDSDPEFDTPIDIFQSLGWFSAEGGHCD